MLRSDREFVYATSACAVKTDPQGKVLAVVAVTGCTIQETHKEALQYAKETALKNFPIEDGWQHHSVDALRMPC